MKNVLWKILYFVLFVICLMGLIVTLFVEQERDYLRAIQIGLLVLAFGGRLFGRKRRALRPNYRLYEETYKEFVRGAFASDKRSYRKLMED